MTTSRLILAGGGSAQDSRPLDEQFARWTNPGGKMLYLPIAMGGHARTYASCQAWISAVFHPLGITQIHMWTDLTDKDPRDLDGFDSIYIGGGNTFRLLSLLRTSSFDQALLDFSARGGAVYGGSAGAIILGKDIMTCAHLDSNDIGLVDPHGLDLVDGHAIWPHYTLGDDDRITNYIKEKGIPVLALSERAGVQVANGRMMAMGYDPVIRFTSQTRQVLAVEHPV